MSADYGILVPEKIIFKTINFLKQNGINISQQNKKLHIFRLKYDNKEKMELFTEFEKLLISEFKKIKNDTSTDDFLFKTFIVNGNELLAEYELSDEMTVFLQLMLLMCKYIGIDFDTNEKYYLTIGNQENDESIDYVSELEFKKGNFNLDI